MSKNANRYQPTKPRAMRNAMADRETALPRLRNLRNVYRVPLDTV